MVYGDILKQDIPALVAEKLRKWEGFLQEYELPAWDMLPGIELYMDQVIALLTQYLTKLGVSPEVAAEDACKLEHVISDESFQAIKRHAHLGMEK